MKKFCIVALATVVAGNAFAGTQTWSFTGSETVENTFGNSLSLTSGSGGDQVTLNVSAWASTGNESVSCEADATESDPCIKDAYLAKYSSGLGIVNRDEYNNNDYDEPQHAIDNIQNGGAAGDFDYEMVLLTFSSEVNLTKLNIGWSLCGTSACTLNSYAAGGKDSDFSILSHNGQSSLQSFNGSSRWSDITSQGWNIVNNYAGVKEHSSVGTPSNNYSKHWLVGAYNNVFGGSMSLNNDAFKLAGLTTVSRDTGPADPVNAPATIGLFGLIALGLLYRRRK